MTIGKIYFCGGQYPTPCAKPYYRRAVYEYTTPDGTWKVAREWKTSAKTGWQKAAATAAEIAEAKKVMLASEKQDRTGVKAVRYRSLVFSKVLTVSGLGVKKIMSAVKAQLGSLEQLVIANSVTQEALKAQVAQLQGQLVGMQAALAQSNAQGQRLASEVQANEARLLQSMALNQRLLVLLQQRVGG